MTREREYFFGEERMRQGGGRGGAGGPRPPLKSQLVKQLKDTMQSAHRTGLNEKLLKYFEPRPGLRQGADLSKKKQPVPFGGLAAYVHMFAGPQDPEEVHQQESKQPRLFKNPELALQCRLNTETRIEKALRLNEWKKEEAIASAAQAAKAWDPHKDTKIEGDPFRTLFVGRLSYDVTEKKLRREFEEFGPIKSVRLVAAKSGKSRGYAFIEYEDKKDMKEAYKAADGRKIEGRRVVVDVERGRTVESWKPRRLGGGLGGEGRTPKPPKPKNARKKALYLPAVGGVLDDRTRLPGARERSPARAPERAAERAPDRDRERDDRDRRERETRDRDREREREREREPRKRERDSSPGRGEDASKRRREVEEGEVRVDRDRDRERERDRDREARPRERSPDRRRRE